MNHATDSRRSLPDQSVRTSLNRRAHLLFVVLLLIASSFCSIGVCAFQLPPPLVVRPIRCMTCRGQYALYSSTTNGEIQAADETIDDTVNHQQQHSEEVTEIENTTNEDDTLNDEVVEIEMLNDAQNTTTQVVTENFTIETGVIQNESEGVQLLATLFSTNILFTTKSRREVPPMFLFPLSLWLKVRSRIPYLHDQFDIPQSKSNGASKQKKRRWEIPLTSAPFQGVDELKSTIVGCIVAIAFYFMVGTLVFPLWLEPSWTLIDALYFSMVTLTTVGYGDVVVSRKHPLAKMFVISFNMLAICISISALGIIGKVALTQERKLMTRAKERARQRLIQMFDSEEEEEDEDDEEEINGKESIEEHDGDDDDHDDDDDDEQCTWAEKVIDEQNKCDIPKNDEPRTIIGAFWRALKNDAYNFVILAFLACVIGKVEGWPVVDILYFWSCTAATIGYGDICPQTQIGRLLAIVFIPLSVVTLGEMIASVFAFVEGRLARKAEKDFLRREITLTDLQYLDVDADGKVCELDFITFMLVAMQKVDRQTMQDIQRIFRALDAGKDGFLQKEDLITLRQRKRFSKRLKREARKKERWFEAKMFEVPKKTKKWFGWSF